MINLTNEENKDDKFDILTRKIDSLEKELNSEKLKSKNFEEEINL